MAEAIAAIGVAAGILQFIDVGSRAVQKAAQIYQQGRSTPAELKAASTSCEGLQRILKDIKASDSSVAFVLMMS